MANPTRKYDWLIVGAGPTGASFARTAAAAGKKVLVVDRRPTIGGLCATNTVGKIQACLFGPHVFHTRDQAVYDFFSSYCTLLPYVHQVKALAAGRYYDWPPNLNTFNQVLGLCTPAEVQAHVSKHGGVGPEVTRLLMDGYSRKMWGHPWAKVDPSIRARIPMAVDFDTRYFPGQLQGFPADGYTAAFARMLEGIEVRLRVDYKDDRGLARIARRTFYTGRLDELYDFQHGVLPYRSVRFETKNVTLPYLGCAVINCPDPSQPWHRLTDHSYFTGAEQAEGPATYE